VSMELNYALNGGGRHRFLGQCETPGERRRGAAGVMPPPLSMASLAMALHDNDSGHCSFASSSYDAQSMSSAGSANSPPPPHRQTTPLLGQPSMYGEFCDVLLQLLIAARFILHFFLTFCRSLYASVAPDMHAPGMRRVILLAAKQ